MILDKPPETKGFRVVGVVEGVVVGAVGVIGCGGCGVSVGVSGVTVCWQCP